MPSKNTKIDNRIVNEYGSTLLQIDYENAKEYAVIVKCGHCGDGYYIPVMFSISAPDIDTAIQCVKTYPKVKRDKKDAVLGAFQITPFESMFIKTLNDRDPYIRAFSTKDDSEVIDRRIKNFNPYCNKERRKQESVDEVDVKMKTADEYQDKYALERFFAPRQFGSNIFIPTRFNKEELLHEFFKQGTLRYGVKRSNPFFLSMYYQIYGKNNDLGIEYCNGYFHYTNEGKKWTCEIPDEYLEKLKKSIKELEEKEKLERKVQEINDDIRLAGRMAEKLSSVDKFNERFKKYKEKMRVMSKMNSVSNGDDLPETSQNEPGGA